MRRIYSAQGRISFGGIVLAMAVLAFACTLGPLPSARADCVGVSVGELDFSSYPEWQGLRTVDVFALFDDPTDEVQAVASIVLDTDSPAGFFNAPYGTDGPSDCFFLQFFPDLNWDTFGTIGIECFDGGNSPILFTPGPWPIAGSHWASGEAGWFTVSGVGIAGDYPGWAVRVLRLTVEDSASISGEFTVAYSGGQLADLVFHLGVGGGACCRPDGSCYVTTWEDCQANGHTYHGDGTDCSPNPCSGACCFEDGECQVTNTPEQCYLAGGVSWRVGQDCTPSPCTGACCLLDGSCVEDIDVDACQAMDSHGWVFAGGCDECPPPPDDGDLCGFQIWIGSDADPVNTATGNFHHAETDFSIASRGRPLVFQRFYNSLNPDAGMLGPGWMHSYGSVLYPEAGEDEVAIRWADGRIDRWTDVGGGTYEPAQWDCYDELVYDAGTWTVTKTNLDVYEFDADGKLTSITDKNANAFTLAYNIDNRLEYVTDPAGRWLTLSYYPDGLLQSVADWTGRTVQYSYDGNGRLEHVTDVLLNTIDYTYDPNGYLATINDQRGVTVVTNQYDPDGRVTHQWDGNGNETEFIYGRRAENETTIRRYLEDRGGQRPVDTIHAHDPDFKKQLLVENPLAQRVDYGYWNFERTEIVDRNGNTTKFDYDTRGNVIKATEADETAVTTVAYDHPSLAHVPTQRTDALSNVTDWSYYAVGNVESEVRWLDVGQTQYVEKRWTYNNEGQRLTETDELGRVHQWVYDPNTGLLTEEIDWDTGDPNDPNDSVEMSHTWYGYDDLWRRIWVTDGRGTGPEDENYKTYYFYDDAGRLIRIEGPPVPDTPDGIVQWFGYDEVGNRAWVTDGDGTGPQDPNHTTWYEYDGHGNLIRVTDALGGVTEYAYDQLNRKVKMADANGNLTDQYTRYVYDDADRLIEREDPEGNVWGYTYDAHGNVLTQADPAGVTITHEYDELNRRVLTYDELNNQTHFEYDELGRLIRQTDAEGNETDFQYDALGRLICVIDAEGGWTEYSYDDAGNLTQIEDAKDDVVSIREYDTLNRLVYAEDGNGNYYTYGYDEVGNQTWVIDANGDTTYLTYDAENRLIQIDYPDDTWVTYEYDNNGNRTGMSEPDGASSFEYDELNRLISSQDRYGQTVGYSYDAVGNRISLTYPPDARQVTYGYDTANRLTTITDWADRQTAYTYACCYRIGTVAYPNGVVETRGYDIAGRLESMNTEDSGGTPLLSFVWQERDGVGNPTSVTETGTLQPTPEQLVTDYEYDADNRLVESSQGTYEYDANGNLTSRTVNGVTTTFEYDHEDRLVSQTTDPNTPQASTVEHAYDGAGSRVARIDNDVATRYVLDRGRSMSHVLCETDANGDITAYYVHGPRLVARIEADGTPHYYHTNDIGNVVALTDEAEQVSDRYAYTPFGLLTAEGVTDNRFTYVGGLGVMTEADGLYFMRARFYDPDTGRFLGKDPVLGALTEPQSLHRYVYGMSTPVRLTDAAGLAPGEVCPGGIWQFNGYYAGGFAGFIIAGGFDQCTWNAWCIDWPTANMTGTTVCGFVGVGIGGGVGVGMCHGAFFGLYNPQVGQLSGQVGFTGVAAGGIVGITFDCMIDLEGGVSVGVAWGVGPGLGAAAGVQGCVTYIWTVSPWNASTSETDVEQQCQDAKNGQ